MREVSSLLLRFFILARARFALAIQIFLMIVPVFADSNPPPSTISKLEVDPKTIEQAQFYNVLIRITRCTTVTGGTCDFTIETGDDFLYYFGNCLLLNKWHLTYTYPDRSLQITLTKSLKVKDACLITVRDTFNHFQQQCLLKKNQLAALTALSALRPFFANFNNDPNYGRQFDIPLLEAFNSCLTSNDY